MSEISLNVEKLSFGYTSEKTIKDITFQIKKGSFVSILGPNGSGKTTLLKNISATLYPQEGSVLLDEKDIYQIKPKKLAQKLAVVPQDTSVGFSFTVLETVLMGRTPYLKRFESEKKADFEIAHRAMELTNTLHLKDRYIDEISGGERQRVIVARALAQEPQVILLDEPVAHLDPQHQMELLELLKSLQKESKLTIVAVLHDLNLAAQFSDYIVLMKKGEIFKSGAPHEVLTKKNIEEVYNMEVMIIPDELTGRFSVIPVTKNKTEIAKIKKDLKIHLICGGGSGAPLMESLVENGFKVSCGVINIGDSDWLTAKKLEVEVVDEAPFSPISDEASKKNANLMANADIVILMPVPFGTGNLLNLEQVYTALEKNKKVIIIGSDNLKSRDFTNGKAEKIFTKIIKRGAILVPELKQIFQVLSEIQGVK